MVKIINPSEEDAERVEDTFKAMCGEVAWDAFPKAMKERLFQHFERGYINTLDGMVNLGERVYLGEVVGALCAVACILHTVAEGMAPEVRDEIWTEVNEIAKTGIAERQGEEDDDGGQ